MTDLYEDIAYEDEYYQPPEPKKGMSGWMIALIIIAALIVICCICLLVALFLVPAVLGPSIGNVFSTVIEEMLTATPMP